MPRLRAGAYWALCAVLFGAGLVLLSTRTYFPWHTPTAGWLALILGALFAVLGIGRPATPWLPFAGLAAVALASYALHAGDKARSDFLVGAQGQIVDARGAPIQGALIRLTFEQPVYRGLEPLTIATAQSDATGEYFLGFLTHDDSVAYTLAVEYQGYSPAVLHGTGHGTHRIVLAELPDRR